VGNAGDDNMLDQVKNYREIVLTYEKLNAEIDKLLSEHGGGTEKMPEGEIERYRELARKRDETLNEMRVLEQQLLDEDTRH
jgi:hypothetical protein